MTNWVLGVQVRGEWEQCTFGTRQEALTAFEALAADYSVDIHRAVLMPQSNSEPFFIPSYRHKYASQCIN